MRSSESTPPRFFDPLKALFKQLSRLEIQPPWRRPIYFPRKHRSAHTRALIGNTIRRKRKIKLRSGRGGESLICLSRLNGCRASNRDYKRRDNNKFDLGQEARKWAKGWHATKRRWVIWTSSIARNTRIDYSISSFYLEKRKKKNSGGKAKARIRERSLDPRAGRKKRERSFSKLGLPLRLVSLVLTLLEREEVGISPGKNEPV